MDILNTTSKFGLLLHLSNEMNSVSHVSEMFSRVFESFEHYPFNRPKERGIYSAMKK